MSKKPGKSTSLVPAGQRKPPVKRKASVPTVLPASTDALRPVLGFDVAVAKLVGLDGEIAREDGVVRVTGRGYATRECVVPAEEIFYDRKARRDDEGARLGEADKVSWHDEASGYDCIMLRDTNRRFLSGYVGIPRDHPLWGWEHAAVAPEFGIDVHGGLTYSHLCQHGPSPTVRLSVEATRVCHVPGFAPPKSAPPAHATDHRVDGNGDAWWFGFSCDHVFDVVPADAHGRARFLQAEVGAVYRDDAYVVRETIALAAQLRAIADGNDVPPRDAPPPPIGLDPRRGGGRG